MIININKENINNIEFINFKLRFNNSGMKYLIVIKIPKEEIPKNNIG